MNNVLFLSALGLGLGLFLAWGFKHLPGERWQMLAVVPTSKHSDNSWFGLNFTYYGFFIATSQMIALALLIVLLGATHISLGGTLTAVAAVLACSLPAARLVAILVEKKRHTFTVGGASFVGIIVAPWAIIGTEKILNWYAGNLPMIPMLAAMAIAYTLGEGLGRLACISFGCCYGKPIKDCRPLMQRIFTRMNFIFQGSMKKAAYESALAGERLIPIQAITSVVYTGGALISSYLFLSGHFTPSLVLAIALSQTWRILSETMRADFRGFSHISAYQKMGLLALLYICVVLYLAPASTADTPDILAGLGTIWSPGPILSLQASWLVFFIWFGRSTITSSTVSFTLLPERL